MRADEMIALLQAFDPASQVEIKIELALFADNGTEVRQYITSQPKKIYQKRELTEIDRLQGRLPVIIVKG